MPPELFLPLQGRDEEPVFPPRAFELPDPLADFDLGFQVPPAVGRDLGVQPPLLPPPPELAFFGFHSPAEPPDVRGLDLGFHPPSLLPLPAFAFLGFHSPELPPPVLALFFGFHPLPSPSRGPVLAGLDFHPSAFRPSGAGLAFLGFHSPPPPLPFDAGFDFQPPLFPPSFDADFRFFHPPFLPDPDRGRGLDFHPPPRRGAS